MVEELIKNIAVCMREHRIPYMLIGGQALLVYGIPRMTKDIDVTLGVDVDKYEQVKSICKELKLRILPSNPEEFARKTRVLPAEDTKLKMRIDFIFSYSNYERQAIARAKKIKLKGCFVAFASPEDLIVHKMVAGRAIDEEDVKGIVVKKRTRIDVRYVRKILRQFNRLPAQADLLEKFNGILKQTT